MSLLLPLHTSAIRKLMQTAKLHIKYPKIRLQSDEITVQLSIAGEKANKPNSINITDGKCYAESRWFGRINNDGYIIWANATSDRLQNAIKEALFHFAENPIAYAKLYSNATGNCMFCRKELTDSQSVAVGYGPVCAETYGLPHGEIEQQAADDMAQVEMKLPESIVDEMPTTLEDKVALLELKVEQLEKIAETTTAILYNLQSNGE